MNRIIFILFVFATTLSSQIFAQDAQEERTKAREGEIEGRKVVINKDLKIELPKADRNFEKVPPPAERPLQNERINYDLPYVDNKLVPELNPTLRVLKIKTERPRLLYGNYLKAGFGNYLSPYLGVYLHSLQSQELSYGATFLHHSAAKGPVDGKNSGDGHTQVKLNGKYMTGNAAISGDAGYSLDIYRFYGYEPGIEVDRDTIKQIFNKFNFSLGFENTNPDSPIKVKGNLHYSGISDNYDVSENYFGLDFSAHYEINDEIGAGFETDVDFRKYETDVSTDRNVFNVKPYVIYHEDLLTINGGIKVSGNNDDLENVSAVTIFPSVQAEYEWSESLTFYGLLEGGIDKVNFTNIVEENPYLKPNVPMYNTINTLNIGGGIKGNVLENLGYQAQLTFGGYKNMYFFINDSVQHNKFDIIYDQGNTDVLKFYGSLTYSRDEKYGADFSLRYFGYNTANVEEAWHRPKGIIGLNGWYNLYDKIIFTTDLQYYTGMKAWDPVTTETINLKDAFDWNAEINYKFSERAGAFIMLNNILGNNYELLNRYPVRGLQVKLGVSLSF